MLRRLAAAGAALVTLLVGSLAQAQEKAGGLGEQGQFIFGADRLFGLFDYTSNSYTTQGNPQQTVTVTGTSMSFFWGTNAVQGASNLGGGVNGVGVAGGNPTFYTPPRLGFDYTIIPNLTIGGELIAFFTLGGSTTTSQGSQSVSNGNPSGNTFGIAPRVGYILGLNDLLSIWLRGGFSYYNASLSQNDNNCRNNTSGTDSVNVWDFGLDLDPQLIISPIPHFAFMAGPALDWGFVGNASATAPNNNGGTCSGTTTTTLNYNSVNFGINGGLLGWW
jgi:hypothetical protein